MPKPTDRRDRDRRPARQYSDPKKAAEQRASGYERTSLVLPEGARWFSLKKAGTYRIDILPYEVQVDTNPFASKGFLHYERTFFVHRDIGPNQDTYICPAKTFKLPCPVCEQRVILGKDEDADEALIKNLIPKERQLFNVIDQAEPDEGVKLWDISYHLFGKLLNTKLRNADEGDNYDAFYHLEDGLTLKITAEEKSMGGGRPFYEVADIEFKPRREQYDEGMLDQVYDLDSLLKQVSYEDLRRLFLQLSEDGDESDASDVAPPARNPKLKPARAAKPAVEEDEEEDAPVAKPARAGKNGKAPPTADSVGIEEGDQVTYKKRAYEVDRISKDGTRLYLVDPETDEELDEPVGAADVQKVAEDWADDAGEDEEEDTPPPKPAKKGGKAPAAKTLDEDEDDPWEDEEDDAPAAKAPKNGKAGKKPAARAEPDDDDEDEPDEPAPRRKQPAAAAAGTKKGGKAPPPEDDDDDDWD